MIFESIISLETVFQTSVNTIETKVNVLETGMWKLKLIAVLR